MAQRDIVGSVLRLLFSAEVSSEISSDMAQREIFGSVLRFHIFGGGLQRDIFIKLAR